MACVCFGILLRWSCLSATSYTGVIGWLLVGGRVLPGRHSFSPNVRSLYTPFLTRVCGGPTLTKQRYFTPETSILNSTGGSMRGSHLVITNASACFLLAK